MIFILKTWLTFFTVIKSYWEVWRNTLHKFYSLRKENPQLRLWILTAFYSGLNGKNLHKKETKCKSIKSVMKIELAGQDIKV